MAGKVISVHVVSGEKENFLPKGFPAPYTLIKECTHCPRYTSRTVDPGFVHVLQLASPSKVYLEALFLLCKSWYSPSGPWLIPGSNNPLLNPRPDPSFCLGSRSWFRISKTGIKVEVDFTNRFNSLHFHTEGRKRWTKSWLVHWNEFLKLAQKKYPRIFFSNEIKKSITQRYLYCSFWFTFSDSVGCTLYSILVPNHQEVVTLPQWKWAIPQLYGCKN